MAGRHDHVGDGMDSTGPWAHVAAGGQPHHSWERRPATPRPDDPTQQPGVCAICMKARCHRARELRRHLLEEHGAIAMVSGNQTERGLVAQYGTLCSWTAKSWSMNAALKEATAETPTKPRAEDDTCDPPPTGVVSWAPLVLYDHCDRRSLLRSTT